VKASKVPATEALFSDETRLLLYALLSQAEDGPCKIRSKWGMELEERAKYETWWGLCEVNPVDR
jgi:acyl-CoA-binding protein